MSEVSSRHLSFKMSRRPNWTSTFESQHRKMLITFGFQKPYIQRSVWIQKKNTTQRPKNLKLKTENWNDKTVRTFSSCCIAYCLSPSSNALLQANGERQCAEDPQGGPTLWEEEARGQRGRCCTGGKEGCYKSPYSEPQTFQSNKALWTDSCCSLSSWITSFHILQ